MMWDSSGVWWNIYGVFMVLIWGGFLALFIWWTTKRSKRDGERETKSNALDIIKERYAKGEISKEEFEQIKKDLS
jgi:putative membrane protein